jgi:pyrroloquinoline-quinone synthase
MKNPADWQYFSVHIEADKEHAAQERALLKTYCNESNEESVLAACNQILDRLWAFLSGMCHRHGIAC